MAVTPPLQAATIPENLKRLEDLLLAGTIMLCISPLMLLIALGVKLSSPGPVIFTQQRHGLRGEKITIYKFRSMSMEQPPQGQRGPNDPRITPFGMLLRRTSLDELPQFINVLQGRMSVVGPRPHACSDDEKFSQLLPGYMQRYAVRPGITGWAQVNGLRGYTDSPEQMQARLEHDLHYINHWSWWLELKILMLTPLRGFVHPNAY